MSVRTFTRIPSLMTMACAWSVGPFMDKFYAELKNQKILGTRCGKCGTVYTPPRSVCGSCWKPLEQWVECGDRGELVNFTVAHVDYRGKPLAAPKVLGLIRLGADPKTLPLFGEIKGVDPAQVKIGMKVAAVWADTRTGELADLSHFVVTAQPAAAPKPAPAAKAAPAAPAKKAKPAKKKAVKKAAAKKTVKQAAKKAVKKAAPKKVARKKAGRPKAVKKAAKKPAAKKRVAKTGRKPAAKKKSAAKKTAKSRARR